MFIDTLLYHDIKKMDNGAARIICPKVYPPKLCQKITQAPAFINSFDNLAASNKKGKV
jgi:hypothetical protein